MKKWLFLPVLFLMLTGCNNASDNAEKQTNEENAVGFEMSGDNIKEAENIPTGEKTKILKAFQEYIDSFNEEDIDRYKNILSKKAEGFNYEEDIELAKENFKKYDIKKTPSDITIVRYSDKEAQVFSKIVTSITDTDYAGRQVTVFVKENDDWKVSSIFHICDQTSDQVSDQTSEKSLNKTSEQPSSDITNPSSKNDKSEQNANESN